MIFKGICTIYVIYIIFLYGFSIDLFGFSDTNSEKTKIALIIR